jgi:hypothetical protein
MIIAVDDPAFTFFIGLCLLRRKREALLLSGADCIPEIIQDLGFQGEEDIDSVVSEAVVLYKRTPRCLCRNLRLCCVATTQLTPTPVSRAKAKDRDSLPGSDRIDGIEDKGKEKGNEIGKEKGKDRQSREEREKAKQKEREIEANIKAMDNHDQTMAVQAARGCVMLNAKELLSSILASDGPGTGPPTDSQKVQELPGQNSSPSSSSSSSTTGTSSSSSDSNGSSSSSDKNNAFYNTTNINSSSDFIDNKNKNVTASSGDLGGGSSSSSSSSRSDALGGIWGGVRGGGAGADMQQFVLIGNDQG